jgi:putative endonuclease
LAEALTVGRAEGKHRDFFFANLTTVYYVYVLRSLRNRKRYVGSTGKAPPEKLAEHNAGATRWTRHNRPFILVHHEMFDDARSARKREMFLKSGKGRHWLDETLAQD